MCEDTVLKICELCRQRVLLSPLYIAPIYVYTYELPGEGGEQIYSAMNRAMRLCSEDAIEFWRPLIWQVDRALQKLPSYQGKLYRGINVRFSEDDYQVLFVAVRGIRRGSVAMGHCRRAQQTPPAARARISYALVPLSPLLPAVQRSRVRVRTVRTGLWHTVRPGGRILLTLRSDLRRTARGSAAYFCFADSQCTTFQLHFCASPICQNNAITNFWQHKI